MTDRCPLLPTEILDEGLDSGAYQLIISLRRSRRILVGALGTFRFRRGTYIYTGRASRYLRTRLGRHLSREKQLRWHIDYLLQWAEVEDIRIFPNRAGAECPINLETAGVEKATFPVIGFGSSDCKCRSHLLLVEGKQADGL
ncbi:DUF123 domain-containing protein [Thermodesulfobacteriota bacterium]